MANFDNDEIDDNYDETEEEQAAAGEPAPSGNRNLFTAIGILGGIFLLLLLAVLVIAYLNRRPASSGANIAATNAVIQTANAGTASAATLAAARLLTPSPTWTATITPTVTKTSVLAPSNTPAGGASSALTLTATGAAVSAVDTRTATVAALLTQRALTSAAQTATKSAGTPAKTAAKASATVKTGTGTPGMPQSGIADEMGLPGLLAISLGLIIMIVLVRRLRLSTNG